jgi:FkbM family methyltransferase
MINSFLKNSTYFLLDLLTLKRGIARKINGMTIRFPAKWSRYYEKNYEADNYVFLQQQVKPGMHIIDIGAHLGLFSACSSQLTGPKGKIICFEPTPGTFAILKNTLKLNHCDNVIALPVAVSDKEGTAMFYVSETAGCNSNSLVKNKPEKESSGYDVQLVTIDHIVAEYNLQPSLIKIDAEGAELDVLKGGIKTFQKYRPVLILGLHPDFILQKGDSLDAIWHVLTEAGYAVKGEGKVFTKTDFCKRIHLFDVHCLRS